MESRLTVREAMTPEFVGASEVDGVVETLELLEREGADCAVVLRGDEPVGAFTPRTACRLLLDGEDPATATVADAMADPLPTVTAGVTLLEAAETMTTERARRLLVTDADGPVGVVTGYDLATAATLFAGPAGGDAETTRATVPESADAEAQADAYAEQSVCERCGALSAALREVEGRLVCADCAES
jgi:CBS domain-containing protein